MKEKELRIPPFSSRDKEAAFWDTHYTTDYEHEFKPVKERFAKNLSQPLTIRLDPETLARMWLLQRLHAEQLTASPTPGRYAHDSCKDGHQLSDVGVQGPLMGTSGL